MQIRYSIFGESHGPAIGVVLENFPAGVTFDPDFIAREMNRRRARSGGLTTQRIESDLPEILSGVFEGKTTGTPLCAIIRNENAHSGDYSRMKTMPRPSHADYTGFVRYNGFNDYRGGGHFSGRLTAPLVFAGAAAKLALKEHHVTIGSHILRIGAEQDTPFDLAAVSSDELEKVVRKDFPVMDDAAGERMKALILRTRENRTSVGGLIQCAVTGLPAGLGSPGCESAEGVFSRNLFAVPAVKGIEFGRGFDFAEDYGHEVNDEYVIRDGKIVTASNNNGGILGGITTGMPVVFQTVFKPTPSISRPQHTVDLAAGTETMLEISGRHDPCIVPRAAAAVEAAAALSALELLCGRMP